MMNTSTNNISIKEIYANKIKTLSLDDALKVTNAVTEYLGSPIDEYTSEEEMVSLLNVEEFKELVINDVIDAINNLELPECMTDVLDNYDISGYTNYNISTRDLDEGNLYIECEFYSPLGEDCLLDVNIPLRNLLKGESFARLFAEKIHTYADDFDADDHARELILCGCDLSVRDLIDDAGEVKQALTDLDTDLADAHREFSKN